MYAQNAAVVLALAGLAAAQTTTTPGPVPVPTGSSNGTITVTKVYDVYTTYCPGPTSFVIGGKDYIVTEPCTLTITDCPCTVVETHAPTWIPQPPPVVPGCPGGDHCVEHPKHPGYPGVPQKPGKPVPGHPHAPGCEGEDCIEYPEKPGKPVTPEHPEKPVTPGKPVVPEQPVKSGVPACEGEHCTTTGETPKTGDNTKGSTPKTSDTACEGDDCAPVIVNGAGAIQLSLGLAAVFGLLAL
ncbi:hypothetical protein CEP54_008779 [Fusarium duplospermum]|uniref:Cell wall protein SED1 n=1 Tax=Fusarium duplospermum TaxID=1325734 RepID=A0A428PU66_9HYPO|nr:hypothetical protein CEP54_008779 [Fusarium duplospermum]